MAPMIVTVSYQPLLCISLVFLFLIVIFLAHSIQATVNELLPLPVEGQTEEIDSTLVSEIRVRVLASMY